MQTDEMAERGVVTGTLATKTVCSMSRVKTGVMEVIWKSA